MYKRKNWAFMSYSVEHICPNCERNVGGLTTNVRQWTENKTDPYPGVRYGELCSKCESNK